MKCEGSACSTKMWRKSRPPGFIQDATRRNSSCSHASLGIDLARLRAQGFKQWSFHRMLNLNKGKHAFHHLQSHGHTRKYLGAQKTAKPLMQVFLMLAFQVQGYLVAPLSY